MASQNVQTQPIFGAGIDRDPSQRPGVPMETEPKPVGHAHWQTPQRQVPTVEVLKRANLDQLTPVFGTAVPPKGLSGAMRRMAYGIPEHKLPHWLILLMADRVDVLEHRLGRALPLVLIAGGVAAVTAMAMPRRRRLVFG